MRLSKVLAATAGTEAGEHAVEVARSLAAAAGAELEVLSVETAGLPAYSGVGDRVSRTESRPHVTWVQGVPGVEITRCAEQWGADLVVLGRDCSGGCPCPLGPTADAVVRRRAGACLLVPQRAGKLDRMLIALDGTQRGMGILEPAAGFAASLGIEARVVWVVPDPGARFPGEARLRDALKQYPTLGGPDILEVRQGMPVRQVIAALQATRSDLLVLGVRRGGPRGEMGSGHVGQDLLREAPVAILTVPI